MKAITTKYHGPTNCKGSRVSAGDGDGARIYLQWNHSLTSEQNHAAAARELCRRMEWTGRYIGGHAQKGMVWVCDDGHSPCVEVK